MLLPAEARRSAFVVREITTLDLQLPLWRYFERLHTWPNSFLLDSAKHVIGLGDYTFLGAEPFLLYSARRRGNSPAAGAEVRLQRFTGDWGSRVEFSAETYVCQDAIAGLQAVMREEFPPEDTSTLRPFPFRAGAVGYFGYEAAYLMEELPDLGRKYLDVPEIRFGFYDLVVGECHRDGTKHLSVVGRGETQAEAQMAADRLRERAVAMLRKAEANLHRSPVPAGTSPGTAPATALQMDSGSEVYQAAVEACLDHIHRGDAFEICLTHRLRRPYSGDPWTLYQTLRTVSPASFACYLNLGETVVLSSSPERFLRLTEDRVVESRPIKGTRPRGATPEEDAALRLDLATCLKDRAENVMIVDLVRNDLGRVCAIGSVTVPTLMAVEEYATVFQLVSAVRGVLKPELGPLDLVRAAFPGGSMTGAPKIEAMKIIDRLEPYKRGIYSGAVGYMDFEGALDLSIVIRTIVLNDGWAYFHAGGAVVADSDPAEEFSETMDKASAIIRALQIASREPVR